MPSFATHRLIRWARRGGFAAGPAQWVMGTLLLLIPVPLLQLAGAWMVLLVAPFHRLAGWLLDDADTPGRRITLASALGFGLAPFPLIALRLVGSPPWSIWLCSGVGSLVAALLGCPWRSPDRRMDRPAEAVGGAADRQGGPGGRRWRAAAALLILFFMLFLVWPTVRVGTSGSACGPADFFFGDCPDPEVYPRLYSLDFFKHVAFTAELGRCDGLMPENPFLAGRPLRYYWFYPLVSAAIRGLTGLDTIRLQLLLILAVAFFFLSTIYQALVSTEPSGRWAFGSLLLLCFSYRMGHLASFLHPELGPGIRLRPGAVLQAAADQRLEILLTTYLDFPLNALFTPHGLIVLATGIWVLLLGLRMSRRGDVLKGVILGVAAAAGVMHNAFIYTGLMVVLGAAALFEPRPPLATPAQHRNRIIPLLVGILAALALLIDFRTAGLLALAVGLALFRPRMPNWRGLPLITATASICGPILFLTLARGRSRGPLFAFSWGAWIETLEPPAVKLAARLVDGSTAAAAFTVFMGALLLAAAMIAARAGSRGGDAPLLRPLLPAAVMLLLAPAFFVLMGSWSHLPPSGEAAAGLPVVNTLAILLLAAKLGPAAVLSLLCLHRSYLGEHPLLNRLVAGALLVFVFLSTSYCFDGRDFALKLSLLHRLLLSLCGGWGLAVILDRKRSTAARPLWGALALLTLIPALPSLPADLTWASNIQARVRFVLDPETRELSEKIRLETPGNAVVQAWGLQGRDRFLVPVFFERRTLWGDPFHAALGTSRREVNTVRDRLVTAMRLGPRQTCRRLREMGADFLLVTQGRRARRLRRAASLRTPGAAAPAIVHDGRKLLLLDIRKPGDRALDGDPRP